MAKFGGQKSILDPRFPFSVSERGHITDLRSDLRMLLVSDAPTSRVKDLQTGTTSTNHTAGEIDTETISSLYGSPTAWRLKNSTMAAPGPAYIPLGNFVSHAKDASTVSFWFKNNSVAPVPLDSAQPVFVVTSGSVSSLNPAPFSKFTAFSARNGSSGEEMTFGWNRTSPVIQWYLSTRSTERRENINFGYPGNSPFGGFAANISTAFTPEMPPNILDYGVWHHIVICTSRGNSNDRTGRQDPNATYFGQSAVYVNGVLFSKYLGFSEPGIVIKPYGSSPVEKYGFLQYEQIAPSQLDKLWFPYNPTTGNRHFYQFCAWDRILSDREVKDLYLGNLQGVYVDSVTSYSSPPRKPRVSPSRTVRNVNVGFLDSQGVGSEQPFDDRRSITGDLKASWGSNYVLDIAKTPFPFYTEKLTNMGVDSSLPAKLILGEVDPLPDTVVNTPYSETIDTVDTTLLDGTQAKAVVRIGIPTQYSPASRQIAGRTDSSFAKTVTSVPTDQCSLFMSSVFKDDVPSFTALTTLGAPVGIAGTGFLYYSPVYKTWLEKRSTGGWVTKSIAEKKKSEYSDSTNSVVFDTAPFSTASANATTFAGFLLQSPTGREKYPWDIASASFGGASRLLAGWYWSGSVSSQPLISGVNETLAQFTSSPQLGYFLPFKEHLERAGYPTIGSPTVAFGAPFAPRYHGYDYETIKLSKYIDRPFRLKKVILKLPVTMIRKNDVQETVFGGAGGAEWTKNTPARKDIDNYVFFLYRQRRQSGSVIDSPSDISSSVRFLVASGSVCVYNSSSFGRAYEDGFSSVFGTGTPVVYEQLPGVYVTASLNSMYNSCNSSLTDPLSTQPLTRHSSPLHGPAYSFNAGITDFSEGTTTYSREEKLEISMYPAVVAGGILNTSLTYVTSTTGHYSSSLFYAEKRGTVSLDQSFNLLFNRYPYTGSYINPNNASRYGPITTGIQNLWLGGTRQPEFVNNAGNGTLSLSNVTASLPYKPYFQYKRGSSNDSVRNGFFIGYVSASYSDPTFDVEVARTGISLTGHDNNAFSSPFEISPDGRTIHSVYSRDNRYDLPSVFQRTNLIRYQLRSTDEGAPGSPLYLMESNTSIGNLSGSNFADLVSSLTVGCNVASPNTNRQIIRDYILLPTDEIILGLDAGVTPAPDVSPLTSEPVPDKLNP